MILTMHAGTLNLTSDISICFHYLSLSLCSKRNNSNVGLLSETLEEKGLMMSLEESCDNDTSSAAGGRELDRL